MLTTLRIQNFALIESLQLDFGPGLTILSGETGAGKSILMNALAVVLGGRSRSEFVREGMDTATVEAHFVLEPKSPVLVRLIETGLQSDDELVIRRQLSRNGRSRSFVNGALVTVQMLSGLTAELVDISGQHAHYSLLRSDQHLALLDRICQLGVLRERVETTYAALAGIDARIEKLVQQKQGRFEKEAFLNFQLAELRDAKLDNPSEEDDLEQEAHRLRNLDILQHTSQQILGKLYTQSGSATDLLGLGLRELQKLCDLDSELESTKKELETAFALVEDVYRTIDHYQTQLEAEPQRLERIELRLSELARLRQKYGLTLSDVIAKRDALEQALIGLSDTDEALEQELNERETVETELVQLAEQLSAARRAGGQSFTKSVEAELAALGMADAKIDLQFKELTSGLRCLNRRVGPSGFEQIELLMSTNAGETVAPLNRIASGGELSRIMLAVKRVIAKQDPVDVYVFDEVDAGVGGKTADRIGEKLREVSKVRQAICITHLPQIAARGDHHFLVSKTVEGGRTFSQTMRLLGDARITEIVRMLGGNDNSKTAREHAASLLR